MPLNRRLADGRWIKPLEEPYFIVHGGPKRVGDEDEIICDSRKGRVRVMLLLDVTGKAWLVEVLVPRKRRARK